MRTEKPNLGVRLASMFVDYFLTSLLMIIPMAPLFFNGMEDRATGEPPLGAGTQFLFLGLMFIYFLKDSFNGRSPAKRMIKLQVVENKTNQVASPARCFLRNLFTIIWPLEVIVTLFSPQRRIGDFVAGTKVVNFPVPPASIFEFE